MLYANRLLLRTLADEMALAHHLDLSWYEVLLHLAEADGQIRQQELLERVLIGQSSLSRTLSQMESAGLVRRAVLASDRRNLLVELTPEGRQRLRAAAPTHLAGIKRWFGDRLTARQAEAIEAGLEKVLRGLTGAELLPAAPAEVASTPSAPVLDESPPTKDAMLAPTVDVPVEDALEIVRALMPVVVADAVRHASSHDIAELRERLSQAARRADSPAEFLSEIWRLHYRLAEVTQNAALRERYLPLAEILERHQVLAVDADRAEDQLRLHASLVEAIAEGDRVEAVGIVEQHCGTAPSERTRVMARERRRSPDIAV
jgi:DNA-binding MarR family transcriptional regulator